MDITKVTISQKYELPNLKEDIHTQVKVCKTFQKNRETPLKYGKIPAKESGAIPWD